MEGVAALLKELVVERLKTGLLRLLFSRARAQLGLRALKRRLLRGCAEAAKLLTSHKLALKILSRHALLASRRLDGLLIRLLVQGRDGLRCGEALLAHKLRALDAGSIAAKRASPDGISLLLGKLLALLLLKGRAGRVHNRLREGVLVILDLLLRQGADALRASQRHAGGSVEVRLRHAGSLIDILNAGLLRLRERRNKSARISTIGLERLRGSGLRLLIDGGVTIHDLLGDLDLLRRCSCLAAHVGSSLLCGFFPSAGLGVVQEECSTRLAKDPLVHPHLTSSSVI